MHKMSSNVIPATGLQDDVMHCTRDLMRFAKPCPHTNPLPLETCISDRINAVLVSISLLSKH